MDIRLLILQLTREPTDNPNKLIKRIKALPGDKLKVLDPHSQSELIMTIPKGYIWVEGDNLVMNIQLYITSFCQITYSSFFQKHSCDSRSFGPVPISLIDGKVSFQVWPLSKFGKPLPHPSLIEVII